jgi:NTE family protein
VGDAAVGYTYNPNIDLAIAVAASSAFPPFLSPLNVRLRPGSVSRANGSGLVVSLADGGVMDNLGLEQAGRYDAVLLSDA